MGGICPRRIRGSLVFPSSPAHGPSCTWSIGDVMVLTGNLLKQPCSHTFHKFKVKDCEFLHRKKYVTLENYYMLKGLTNTIRIMLSVPLRYSLNKIS